MKNSEKKNHSSLLRTVHLFIHREKKYTIFVHLFRASNCIIRFSDSDTSNK